MQNIGLFDAESAKTKQLTNDSCDAVMKSVVHCNEIVLFKKKMFSVWAFQCQKYEAR